MSDDLRIFEFCGQRGFVDRWKYYVAMCNPINAFASNQQLTEAKEKVIEYKAGKLTSEVAIDKLHHWHSLYLSAFHPDTGDLQNVFGRMSFQVPGGTILIASMLIFYKSNAAVVFWQTANQTFNAVVNYTNRNAKSNLDEKQIGLACASATISAVIVSLGLKKLFSKRAGNLAQRLVPLVAVAAANAVNIPLMRQNELKNGILLVDEKDEPLVESKVAALKAVSLVTLSRLAIVTPSMLVTPLVMESVANHKWFMRRRAMLNVPMQTALTALCLFIMVPVGCAIFPQRNSVQAVTLHKWEPKQYDKLCQLTKSHVYYFNKGL